MVLILVGGFIIAAFIAICIAASRPKADPDAVQLAVLRQLEQEAARELSHDQKSEMYAELSKITDIAVNAAQMRGLTPPEFDRLYRKGAIQVYSTALGLARHFRAEAKA